jgi:methylated-DNA-[protein]-cysteine S-methyltransferase
MSTYFTRIPSPLGPLTLTESGGRLTGLHLPNDRHQSLDRAGWIFDPDRFAAAAAELGDYFAGRRRQFDVAWVFDRGTEFQRRVWTTLAEIPYGETWSYRQLAERVGSPAACRAVGLANGRNPLAIILPCHRVIGADGSLTGYGGGLDRKRFLLDLERGSGGAAEPAAWQMRDFLMG